MFGDSQFFLRILIKVINLIKAGTWIIGQIFVSISLLWSKPAKADYLMFKKDIVSDFLVVWGVLGVIVCVNKERA